MLDFLSKHVLVKPNVKNVLKKDISKHARIFVTVVRLEENVFHKMRNKNFQIFKIKR